MKIIELDEVGSTDEYSKTNGSGEDLCVFASAGRQIFGRLGREYV